MKNYQDPDPLHGNGKAMPHPKRPTQYTYRGRLTCPVSIDRTTFSYERRMNRETAKASGFAPWSIIGLITACLGFRRGR